jgi:hypothetical protein
VRERERKAWRFINFNTNIIIHFFSQLLRGIFNVNVTIFLFAMLFYDDVKKYFSDDCVTKGED